MNHFIVDGRYKDILKYYGVDIAAVLRKARLPEDILNHKTVKMKEEEYYRFMDAIDCISQDTEMPIKLSTTSQIENFSPPIFASYCSKNGLVCIERLARYKRLIGPMTFLVDKGNMNTTVEIIAGEDGIEISGFLVQVEMVFLVNMIRNATKEEIVPLHITLKETPKDKSFEKFMGIAPTVGMKNTISFRKNDLEEPFVSHSDAMWSYFEPELNRRLAELDIDVSISAKVRSALTELLPGGLFGINDVAEKLGLSKRTLQRKLSDEKTTFQKQLNSTRETLALHYVSNTDMTTNDIAYLLGYAELNSFLRAFSIWTGENVSVYRQYHKQK